VFTWSVWKLSVQCAIISCDLPSVPAGRVHLCRLAGNTVIPYGKWRPVALRRGPRNSYTLPLPLFTFTECTNCPTTASNEVYRSCHCICSVGRSFGQWAGSVIARRRRVVTSVNAAVRAATSGILHRPSVRLYVNEHTALIYGILVNSVSSIFTVLFCHQRFAMVSNTLSR